MVIQDVVQREMRVIESRAVNRACCILATIMTVIAVCLGERLGYPFVGILKAPAVFWAPVPGVLFGFNGLTGTFMAIFSIFVGYFSVLQLVLMVWAGPSHFGRLRLYAYATLIVLLWWPGLVLALTFG